MTKILKTLRLALIATVSAFALNAQAETYIVKPGDTLSTIARQAFVGPIYGETGSLAKILNSNPDLTAQSLILPGQKIELGDRAFTEHRIESGDTLSMIAARYSKLPTYGPQGALAQLMKANPEVNPAQLIPGQVVFVPVSETPAEVAREIAAVIPSPKLMAPKIQYPRIEEESAPNRIESKAIARDAKQAFKQKQFDRALDGYRQARTLDAGLLTNWLGEIRSLAALNRRHEARALASELVERRPSLKKVTYIQRILRE